MSKPVLISGAGLSGLLLALSLHAASIPFIIYERDSADSSRSQGYRIRLNQQGLNALRSTLTPQAFEEVKKGCSDTKGGGFIAYNAVTFEQTKFGPPGKTPQSAGEVLGIDRVFLRNQLFKGIEDRVVFDKTVSGYKVLEDGVVAIFSDGNESEEGSLLVGSDGVHSKITRQLTRNQLKVYDTGARMIHGSTPRQAFDALSKGRFSAFALVDNENTMGKIAMITNVREEVGDDIHFGWVLTGTPGSFDAPNNDFSVSGQPAVDISLQLTENWHPDLRQIIDNQKIEEAAFLKMSSSDPGGIFKWDNEKRVTIMGDAVHAMTPAGGVGANTALADAELLGRLLRKGCGWKDGVTEEYELEMRVYAGDNVKMSFENASRMFGIKELSVTI